MKQVFRYDTETGEYIEPVIIYQIDENGAYVIPDDCTEKELPKPNWKPIFINGDWVETITEEELLPQYRNAKDAELNQACNESILAGFTHEINGVLYWFSYDYEAQGNFGDAKDALKDGIVPAIPWTVREGGVNGPYARILVDLTLMNQIAISILKHKTDNIGKYRDTLMPIVEEATRIDEIQAVTWE